MRALTIAIASAVHVGALVLVSRCENEAALKRSPDRKPVAIEILPPQSVSPARESSLDVAFLPEQVPAVDHDTAHHTARIGREPNTSHRETTWRANQPEAPRDPDEEHGPSTSSLGMRGQHHHLALTEEVADRIAGEPEHATSASTTADELRGAHDPNIKLTPNGAAGHVIRDRVATVTVAPDGSARIADAADMSIRLNVPSLSKLRRRIARDLTAWIADPYSDTKVGRGQDLPAHMRAVPGACDSFGSLNCVTPVEENKMRQVEDDQLASTVLISGRVDLTSYLQRKFVSDPFASRKLKILDQTRDERIRLGAEFRSDQRRRSAELMQRNLDTLARATSDPAERRAAVLALFDECEGDEAGRRARAMVIGWIRAHLITAFTAEELADLERRAVR